MNAIKVEDVKEFQMRNLHATGQSYISALEDETKYPCINGVEEVMKLLKAQMKGFKNERTGMFSRWEYFSMHFCSYMYEILKDNEVNNFIDLFKRSNTIEISEVCGKHFEILVTRKGETFEVVVKTYAYIGINESAIQYLDEEQGKLMIARKLYLLKKNS
jgi:hypothetical protein